ncbi:hypothetical protein [Pseudomonas sp. NPDC096950]|uniref:hypothetical protein n=1 Tax=Pseudomonas sp. NPDC096950 TaxID=3364485 RepID=UPI00383AF5E2
MVITPKIACNTCDTKHLLKVTVGREDKQNHIFPCTECEEEIEFGLESLFSRGQYRYIRNCRADNFDYSEAIQVHLNPDFGTSHKIVQAGDIFTAVMSNCLEMQRMDALLRKEQNEGIIEHRANYENYNSEAMRFYLKICSLLSKNKNELANSYIEKNKTNFDEKTGETYNYYFEKLLNHLLGSYGLELLNAITEEKNKAGDISTLIDFNTTQSIDNLESIEEFIGLFSEFSQVFTYLNKGIEISDSVKPTSTDFNRTKKYYSSAYETLAKMLFIPAGLNNAIERGDPHRFEKIDSLGKFISNGNGDKLRCIKDNINLNKISSCYDNHLRNASFHSHMKYNPKKAKISFNQNNGTPISITYKEYLVMCIKVTEAIAALNLFSLKHLQPVQIKPDQI